MRSQRRAALVAATMAGALALTACSSGGGSSDAEESADLTVWFMRNDVPEVAQEWLVDTWAEQNDGAELTIEIQDWDGIVTRLQTTLASPDQTPDLVEFGNSQVITFSAAGALSDISDMQEEIGGDELVPSLVEAGTFDGSLYAAPMFAGSRVIYYRESLFEEAGIPLPTSIEELTDAAIALQAANPEGTDDFEGMYLPARDFGSAMGWVFTYGANFAEQDGEEWVGTLSEPEGIAALENLQRLYTEGTATAASASVDESRQPYIAYNEGRAGMFSGLHLMYDEIAPELQEDTGVMALPGEEPGSVGHVFAGGSNLGIPAASENQEYARDLLRLTMSEEFQTYFASDGGWVPGNSTYAEPLAETEVGEAEITAVENAVMTPNAENWGVVEGNDVIRDMMVQLAQGEDPQTLAADTDATVAQLLND
ncbi:extracellular solute-binding protein [Ruania suaedae]|uniref:extracellular solute-binding protein n=1 Tax=Ruania suaedae TaxID=2897774 RepID=UPI001E5DD9A0|nr:extracellular solute-binding protein [Ruania suaedae]UFU03576.1 extracellular solute-binding protein [Ruania suaedae]